MSTPPAAGATNRSLDVLRGVAALLVVLGHTRYHLLTALDLPTSGTGPLQHLLLAPTLLAKESVAVFFVLSGYLVGGQVVRLVRADRFGWRDYLGKRVSRLWTVLLPGLLLTFAVDLVDRARFGATFRELQPPVHLDPLTAVCNALFLQQGRCTVYGSNESLWSLGYEFWFYVLFAGLAVAVAAVSRRSGRQALAGLVVAASCVAVFGPQLLWFFPAWLAGVGVAVAHQSFAAHGTPRWLPTGRRAVAVSGLGVLAAMVASNRLIEDDPLRFIVVALPTTVLVLVLALAQPWPTSTPGRFAARGGDWLGARSFTVYLLHLPLVKLGVGLAAAAGPWGSWSGVLGTYVLSGAAVLLCCQLYRLTEQHTSRVRRGLLRVLGVRPSAAVTSPPLTSPARRR